MIKETPIIMKSVSWLPKARAGGVGKGGRPLQRWSGACNVIPISYYLATSK